MKKRNLIILILTAAILFLSFSACAPSSQTSEPQGDTFRFEDFAGSEVSDIQKVDLDKDLSEKCTSYKFTYLSDGYRINAYISIPNSSLNSKEPTKCVLFNRGGNRDFGRLDSNATANICSICNRIVIASQYRGADGSEGSDQFGGDDLHDVIKLIDLCENNFTFVDMDDFCVSGSSRGGMMTYMAARQDKRIKRIIAISAASDLFDLYECRDDMKSVLLETIGCTPQDNPAEYEKRSAIRWYDEIKVPVLILHCKKDDQVPFRQAEAMYEKLKDSTECKFITHDDNIHGTIHKEDIPAIQDWLNN